jgi:hypothetical protein
MKLGDIFAGEVYDDAAWVSMKKFAPAYAKYDENAASVSVALG